MTEDELLERIAQLEFQNDQLISEMQYIDTLLRKIGFANGLQSVKEAARELAGDEGQSNEPTPPE